MTEWKTRAAGMSGIWTGILIGLVFAAVIAAITLWIMHCAGAGTLPSLPPDPFDQEVTS